MSAICDAHKKKVVAELLYNSVHRKFNQLGIRFGRENQHPERLGPRLSSPREWERNAVVAIGVGVNMLQFCSVSNSLSHTTLSIKWEVYFSKEQCCSSLSLRLCDSACICVRIVFMAIQQFHCSIVLSLSALVHRRLLKLFWFLNCDFLTAILSYGLVSEVISSQWMLAHFFHNIRSVVQWCLNHSAFFHASWWCRWNFPQHR